MLTVELDNRTKQEAALVILVPEADELVASFQARSDHSSSEEMPAHITINYPFQPQQPDWGQLTKELADLFSIFPPVRYKITELRKFPDTLYLAIEPDQPFRDMIEAVASRYPESPPYGGTIIEVVPHLTVTEVTPGADLRGIVHEFTVMSKGKLPIESKACEVWFMDYQDNFWFKRIAFDLGK
jgi:2'-5' RNA ligase